MMKKIIGIVFVLIFVASGVMASSPIQFSITPEVAVVDRDVRIEGLSLGIWSENPQTALALGVVSGSRGQSAGLSWSFLLNYADSYKGIQWALVNYNRANFLGWQSGLVNYTEGTMKGLQTGAINYADRLIGMQWGFFNYAETVETGVQIGVVNIIPRNAWFSELPNELAPGMIFVNWKF